MALIVLMSGRLTSTQENLWWGAVIGGFVVVLAVAGLLTVLVVEVRTHRPAGGPGPRHAGGGGGQHR